MLKFDLKTLERPFEANWPVKVQVPQDGGGVEEQEFTARFRTLTPAERDVTAGRHLEQLKLALMQVEGDDVTADMFELLIGRGYVLTALLKARTGFEIGSPAKN